MGAKIILVGDIKSYQSKFNLLYNEINKGNISVVGAIFNNFNHAKLDDIPVYKNFDEIKSLKFDYFILLSDNKDIYKKNF